MSKCECCKEENSDLITYKGYKMCPACYMGYVRKVKVCENNAKYETEIDQLKQQLAEKDKEIERLRNLFKLNNEVVINQGKEIFDLRVQVLQQKQNQTQLAIQELEKTKDLLLNESKNNPIIYDVNDDLVGGAIDKDAVFKIIDQQIKELKGEKDVKD